MFNINLSKQKLLRKESIAIFCILIGGSLLSIAYAASTIITDTSITTTDLTVTGTCTGCGAGEGSFTSYNTIALNTTTTGSDTFGMCSVLVGNDGATLSGGTVQTQLVYLNGTTVYNQSAVSSCAGSGIPVIAQSITGEYKVVMDGSTFTVSVFKNGNLLENLGLNISQYHTANPLQVGISSDGKYISVIGRDVGATSDRLVVFRGS